MVRVMENIVSYRLDGPVATIVMDDGKVNAMSPRMLGEVGAAFDRAEADRAVVVLTGREGVFSAGFDLPTLRAGGAESIGMVRAGFELAERILSFPFPVVVACTGHAVAMGVFLALSGDYRVGVEGNFRLAANEVAIGLTMPYPAIEILRNRLTPSAFNRAVTLAEPFSPTNAVESGFLDAVVTADELAATARTIATAASTLDMAAHAASKLRARGAMLAAMRTGTDAQYSIFVP
jgi:enoyl-CoA hydratase/carnithine racemase